VTAPFVTRFAPSPTGYLHLGHAYSALIAWRAAKVAGGRFILRIEDIDETRSRPAFEAAIFEDLAWLGLSWEQPVRRQSDHLGDYRNALKRLAERGLVYRCFKTRREVIEAMTAAPHGPEEIYRGAPLSPREEADRLAADEPFAWRLSLDAARAALGSGWDGLTLRDADRGETPAQPALVGDVVLGRKDVGVAYHLAVVVDDALQGINHVIRGEDLAPAAHVQRLLQALLDLPPVTYRHHRLILGEDGKRLAKRDKSAALRALREAGKTPAEVAAKVGL
jgi:glutamyl-Q tRNA(Asp) synthetase